MGRSFEPPPAPEVGRDRRDAGNARGEEAAPSELGSFDLRRPRPGELHLRLEGANIAKARRQLRQVGAGSLAGAAARPAERAPETLPLSIAQRGIWIGQKISRDGTVFNVAEAVEIDGPVEPELFQATLRQVAEEADAARANIFEDANGPHQVIHPHYKGELPFVDFSSELDPEAKARAWMMSDVTAVLDLERDPLWFSALVKVEARRFFWYQRAHHIIYDGFSGGLVARRIAEIYNALLAGEPPPPPSFGPLRRMIEDEAAYRNSSAFKRDREYWRDRLKDLPEPVSFAQGRWPTGSGLARESLFVTPENTARLRETAKQFGCTMPQLLISLAAAFVYRTTDAEDLVLGMPVAARTKATRNIPGMAANGIVLRLSMRPDLTWPALVAETAREVRRALRRQLYRFEDMRRDLGFTGQHQHVARIAVNIEPFDYNLTIGGHSTSAQNLANSSVEDLVLFVYDRGDGKGLHADFDANPSLYTADELRAHCRRFQDLLDAFLEDPEGAIGTADFLSREERERLILAWNAPSRAFPDRPAFALFEEQAARTPHATALRFEGKSLSYEELNGRANHLARALMAAGIGAGDIVALALPKSERRVIALLAISKTGAAFLPVEASDPTMRLAQIFGDAGVRGVVCDRSDETRLAAAGARTIAVENFGEAIDARNVTDEERRAPLRQADPAYVIYTSGTTGTPKGALIAHAGLTNMIADAIEFLPLTAEDRLLAVSAPTFDASIFEIHAPLAAGAALLLAPPATVREPVKLAELMRVEGATVMLATPPLWDALIASRAARLRGLKAAIGGDVLTSRLARALHDLGADVHNLYGPTEATVLCTHMAIGEAELASPPIGRAIANMRAYILDRHLNLLPAGVAGELCIGGVGVGLGYVNCPELTAERFPPDPFANDGSRLYRTGDLARWRPDGVLEFLGRRDQQLKIRGYRVEPGEVEAALLSCAGVNSAHVGAVESFRRGRQLAAYVTAKSGATLDRESIRKALAERLPEYLVPSLIFVIDALPLTASGKIDRAALPQAEERSVSGYVAPRTPTEAKLADIFAKMLGLERVGVEDNFFDIGADSLTAVQLLLEIETQFSTQLSLVSLFDAPTIANLARQMDDNAAPNPLTPVFPLRKQGEGAPLFCVHSVVGVAWSFAGLLRHLGARQAVYGLQARGLCGDDEALPASVDAMAEDYLAEIRAIQPRGPYRLLGWSLGGLAAQAIAAKIEAAGEHVDFLGLLDAFPFLEDDPDAVSDEESLAATALRFMNYAPDALGDRLDMASLEEFMFREFDLFSIPIMKKAGFDGPDIRRRFARVLRNNFAIVRRHRPQVVKADIHVFRATMDKFERLDQVIAHQSGAWRAYTAGKLIEHDIACQHFAMLNAEPLATIGPIVRRAMGATAAKPA